MRYFRYLLWTCFFVSVPWIKGAYAGSAIRNSPHYEEAPGCRDLVYKAMEGVAYSNAVYGASTAEELILKPESVFQITCFDKQIDNAARSSRDRHLNLDRLNNRAQSKVINYANKYLAANYGDNIIGRLVTADCRTAFNLWDALTGNGILRWDLNKNGAPGKPRLDGVYNYSPQDIWGNLPIPTAWSLNNEKTSVIDAVADANIDALEQELFDMTDDVQSGMLDPAGANYGGYDAATGLGYNVEKVFDTIK